MLGRRGARGGTHGGIGGRAGQDEACEGKEANHAVLGSAPESGGLPPYVGRWIEVVPQLSQLPPVRLERASARALGGGEGRVVEKEEVERKEGHAAVHSGECRRGGGGGGEAGEDVERLEGLEGALVGDAGVLVVRRLEQIRMDPQQKLAPQRLHWLGFAAPQRVSFAWWWWPRVPPPPVGGTSTSTGVLC